MFTVMFHVFLQFLLCTLPVFDSPSLSQRHFEQRFGKSELLLPHSVGQDLSIRVVSVGLVPQLKQLPDSHTQRPETQDEKDADQREDVSVSMGSSESFHH